MKANRAQRRKYKPGQGASFQGTIAEWLEEPNLVARRAEVWEVSLRAARIYHLERIHNRPWWRVARFLRGLIERLWGSKDDG